MRKSLVRGVGVISGVITAAAVFGTGSASAVNEYAGLTYEQVLEYAGSAVIASRVGQYLPTEQCIVTGSRSGSYLDSSGNNRGGVYVDLNCNDPKTTSGHGGYSVATPQGKKTKAERDYAKSISQNFAEATAAGQTSWCAENADKCWNACDQSGECSAEVEEFLGM